MNKRSKGRGSDLNVPNPYLAIHQEPDADFLNAQLDDPDFAGAVQTEFQNDSASSIVSENQSPDIPFRYSLNPYRGCEHGCSYCYARPTHEYYGLNAALDFESQIFVKHNAAGLLRDFLNRPGYQPEPIVFSGVTDCYQPAERKFELTRRCLEVALEARQPVSIITKNSLVLRDVDLLRELAQDNLCRVSLSITTLDAKLARDLEPRTSPPVARLRTIAELSQAGVPAHAMLAPMIPGLTDSEIPAILEQAAIAGAQSAGFLMLRLPRTVLPVFVDWLHKRRPEKAALVESRLRSIRDGELNSSTFGERMRGTGPIADQIKQVFAVFAKKFSLQSKPAPLNCDLFRPPTSSTGQQTLF